MVYIEDDVVVNDIKGDGAPMHQQEYKINHEYEIALRSLNPDGWARMTLQDKVHTLQAIEDKIAYDTGRIPAEITIDEKLTECQLGMQRENSIILSSAALNDPDFLNEAVNTTYHEGSHARDWQANYIPNVRAGYKPEDLAARQAPIPDPEQDWDGYWNHPAEQAARSAGELGVRKTIEDQQTIAAADNEMQAASCGNSRNQILETYDHLALEENSDPTMFAPDSELETGSNWEYDALSYEVTEPNDNWDFSPDLPDSNDVSAEINDVCDTIEVSINDEE